jgi:hypothetical protein
MASSSFPARALSLGDDYGNAPKVVRMRPGQDEPMAASADYGRDIPNVKNYPKAKEMDGDPSKVSPGEWSRGVVNKDQRAYNQEQKAYQAYLEATYGPQSKQQSSAPQQAAQPIRRPAQGVDAAGYAYLQYPDGSISIAATPTGRGIGERYPAGSEAANNVEAAHGRYPATGVDKAMNVFAQMVGQTAQAFVASSASKEPVHEKKKDNTLLYVGGAVVGAAFLGLVVWGISKSGSSSKKAV